MEIPVRRSTALLAATLLLSSGLATAGEYSEKLSKCLLSSTTEADRTSLVRWVFGAVASHPEVADLSNLPEEKWDDLSRDAARVFEKLIAETCATESREAILNEGTAGYKSAFETLGSTAVGGLMTDPKVVQAMGGLDKHLSEEKLMKALLTGTSQAQ